MKKIEKVLTDNPFVDELVYYTKLLAINAVIKNEEEATKYETIESIKASDIYIACREGWARFDMFIYDKKFLQLHTALTGDFLEMCVKDNTRIPENLRPKLLELKIEEYIDNYEELNTYYRMLMGLPPVGDKGIYVKQEYVEGITGVDITKPVHLMTIDELTILYSHDVIEQLIADNPDQKYLNFMGDNAIDVYKARKANNFQILYIPVIDSPEVLDKWNLKYEQNRMFTIKTVYSQAYKYGSDYYDNFIMVFILIQTMIDVISEVQEFIARKDIFDDRSIRYVFESNGIPYYPEIPRKFQLAMIRNLHTLLKYKASTKNMVDICSLFGFDEIKIFRYYLLRDRRFVEDGDTIKWNDEYQFNYKEVEDDNGNPIIVDDNDKNYDLKFIKVPIDEKVDDYIKDRRNYEDYDDITYQDEFWDGKLPHEQIKSGILDKEFSWVRTKYISIDTVYDLTQLSFDLPYFINMMFDDTIVEENLTIQIPHIQNNHRFRIADVFVYLFALTYEYNEIEDRIMDTRGKILSILGFNFHVDIHELTMDLFNNHYQADLNKMGADLFYIPSGDLPSFDELVRVFTQNKGIYNLVVDGMRNADNKRIYDAYKKVYESYYIMDLTFTFFKLSNGKQAETYTEFLQERDYVLYESVMEMRNIADKLSKQKTIADTIIDVIYAIDEYMDTDYFRYVFARFPAVSADYVKSYMIKIINFFKSYKVHMLGIGTVYKSFDKRENTIRLIDDMYLTGKHTFNEILTLIDDITAAIDLTHADKVDLLERLWFDIERWEYLDYKDKFEMHIKNGIAAIMNQMTYDDFVELVDHEKDFPFYEIIYTVERGELFYMVQQMTCNNNVELKDYGTPFDKIQIITKNE